MPARTSDGCQPPIAVKPGRLSESKQGHHVFEGVSAQSTGARALCMHVIAIPPGGRARAHLHEDHESAVYVVEGEVICWYGDQPVTCIVARTDPNEQESVVVLPELDALAHVQSPSATVVELDNVRR